MLQLTKSRVKLLELKTMFIAALCDVFLMKLRWSKNKGLLSDRYVNYAINYFAQQPIGISERPHAVLEISKFYKLQ